MEAHSGLSARIAEEAGFRGLWASGLAISSLYGVRDNNELSWSQLAELLEFMSDATTVPILVDGDTGHGNFNNLRRLVKKLEQRGIAGVCIEDKVFPKSNSFLKGERQPLADVDEFCGKIKAGKDTQRDPDFCIVARVEALIAGWSMDEALRRAEAYRAAGADAILIHSKRSQASEVLAFAHEWARRAPLVVVPTTYYSTPVDVLEHAGIDLVIWANHLLRGSLQAMTQVARAVQQSRSVAEVEDRIAPLHEVFRLQGAAELEAAEDRYLAGRRRPGAVVLGATRGRGLDELTVDRPKVMVPVGGRPLLRRLVDEFKTQGVNDVTVVAGYKPEAIDVPGIRLVYNLEHATTGELRSLDAARSALAAHDDVLITYGDLLFRRYILRDLLDAPGAVTVVVESAPADARAGAGGGGAGGGAGAGSRDWAWCSRPDDHALFGREVWLRHVSEDRGAHDGAPDGRWIGMLRVRGEGRQWLLQALDELKAEPGFARLDVPHLLSRLVAGDRPVHVHYVTGHWLDVNGVVDLDRAGRFAEPGRGQLAPEPLASQPPASGPGAPEPRAPEQRPSEQRPSEQRS